MRHTPNHSDCLRIGAHRDCNKYRGVGGRLQRDCFRLDALGVTSVASNRPKSAPLRVSAWTLRQFDRYFLAMRSMRITWVLIGLATSLSLAVTGCGKSASGLATDGAAKVDAPASTGGSLGGGGGAATGGAGGAGGMAGTGGTSGPGGTLELCGGGGNCYRSCPTAKEAAAERQARAVRPIGAVRGVVRPPAALAPTAVPLAWTVVPLASTLASHVALAGCPARRISFASRARCTPTTSIRICTSHPW